MNDLFVSFLEDYQGGMSHFQDDYLVTVRAGLTEYGQYKQALRELMTRIRSINQAYRDAALLRVDLAEWDHELGIGTKPVTEFDRRRIEIQRDAARVDLVFLEKRVHELESEFARFWQQAEVLKERIGDLDPGKRRALEADYWMALLIERWVLNGGREDDKLLRDLAAMPAEVQEKLLKVFALPYLEAKEGYLTRDGDPFEGLPLPDGRMGREEIRALLDDLKTPLIPPGTGGGDGDLLIGGE